MPNRKSSLQKHQLHCCGTKIIMLCFALFGIILTITQISSVLTANDRAAPSSLEFVIVVCRHGSRSPVDTYPLDTYVWPDGKHSLTKKGKQQMYKVGQTLRTRYGEYLGQKYNFKDVYVRSTPSIRTHMSAALLVAGMFPPTGHNVWNTDLNWQPIPIWTDEYDKSSKIAINATNCPRFSAEQRREFQSVGYHLEENRELAAYLTEQTNQPMANHLDFLTVWDPLICKAENDIPLPTWSGSVYPNKMLKVVEKIFKTMVSATPTMNRFMSGPLLKDFDSWITRKVNNQLGEKMLLHSGHDFTIIGLLSAVGFTELRRTQPAASVVLEIHKSPVYEHEVKMLYYNNSETEEPVSLNMPKCSDPCPLSTFLSVIRELELEVSDWNAECRQSLS